MQTFDDEITDRAVTNLVTIVAVNYILLYGLVAVLWAALPSPFSLASSLFAFTINYQMGAWGSHAHNQNQWAQAVGLRNLHAVLIEVNRIGSKQEEEPDVIKLADRAIQVTPLSPRVPIAERLTRGLFKFGVEIVLLCGAAYLGALYRPEMANLVRGIDSMIR